jgi:hypothetical protein
MQHKLNWILFVPILLVFLLGATACSSKNAECKVTLDGDGNLDIIVNPPGESGESTQDGKLTRNMNISSSGGDINRITTYTGEIEKQFKESGNLYTIVVDIEIDQDRLTAYQLTVSGGVYGESPHICSKP